MEEIRQCFPKHLENLKPTWVDTYGDVEVEMKSWYNGYSWDGTNLGDAAAALSQIKAKKYHQKFLHSGKKEVLLGIGFDVEERNVGGWVVEEASAPIV